MNAYQAPLRDMGFVVKELLELSTVTRLPSFGELGEDLFDAILEESARFSREVLDPLNRVGDREGARLQDGQVITSPGFKDAYQRFVEVGWNGLTASPEHGGQGLPNLLAAPLEEMWHAANMAFTLCPLLTRGAIEAIHFAGSEDLRRRFLPPMVTGQWAGTMNLTEPQAGSDLAALRTRAVPEGDHYRITGQKIFITYGEQDFTENIVHLVLARIPGAPEGVKGISLFLVPKFLLNEDGTPGLRNDVRAVSLEHKLGIHGSPTCVMAYGDNGGAVGYLLGKENAGLEIMFVMMNAARFSVGVQGLAIAERAYQGAVHYARERVQGIPVGLGQRAPIAHHPDVHRMLSAIRARIEGCRALAYYAGQMLDLASAHPDAQERARAQARSDVLTPIVKGFCTESGVWAANEAIQVHGGMGYIEETGAAQYLRDARITTIYEGTTGIQANDLLGRKLLRDRGASVSSLLDEIGASVPALQGPAEVREVADGVARVLALARTATQHLLVTAVSRPADAFGSAVPYLHLMGWLVSGWLMARSAAIAAANKETSGNDRDFYRHKLATCRYFAVHSLSGCEGLASTIVHGAASLAGMPVSTAMEGP
jgi:alkylation response protein AidB-like acyl-CoA dehydrogenase